MHVSSHFLSTGNVELCHVLSPRVSLNSNNTAQVLHNIVKQVKSLSLKLHQRIKHVQKSGVFLRWVKQTESCFTGPGTNTLAIKTTMSSFITVF